MQYESVGQNNIEDHIIVLNDDRTKPSTFLHYKVADKSVFYFNGFQLYRDTIKYMIKHKRHVTVIPIYTDIQTLLLIVQFIFGLKDVEKSMVMKQRIIQQYKYYSKTDLLDERIGLEPLPVRLFICIDRAQFNADVTSAEFVMVQQLCRLVALIHGSSVIITSNLHELMQDHIQTTRILNTIGVINDIYPEPEPLYKDGSIDVIRLLIPAGWDSWSKIILLAKSIVYEPGTSSYKLFTSESELHQIIKLYISYLNCEIESTDIVSMIQSI